MSAIFFARPQALQRIRVLEKMDDDALESAQHDRALRGLARLNRLARSHSILWPQVRRYAMQSEARGKMLRILDVATASADLPVAMDAAARREGLGIEWVLCDRSEHALHRAVERATTAGLRFTTACMDALSEPLPRGCDLVISSLFLHHIDPAQVVELLRSMRQAAGVAVGVADLDRTRLGLCFAALGAHLLSRSPIVHFDAVASVRAAHTREEILRLACEAGLSNASVGKAWPQRWSVWWQCQHEANPIEPVRR